MRFLIFLFQLAAELCLAIPSTAIRLDDRFLRNQRAGSNDRACADRVRHSG